LLISDVPATTLTLPRSDLKEIAATMIATGAGARPSLPEKS
jgi:hypothetical protein